MKIERLHSWPGASSPEVRPVCQADVQVVGDWQRSTRKEWHEKGVRRYAGLERPNQCTFLAVVILDGKKLCRRHAGQVALDWVLKQADAINCTEGEDNAQS